MTTDIIEKLENRFTNYVQINTQSDPSVLSVPSTAGQTELAQKLVAELKSLGVRDVEIDKHSIVTAIIPGKPNKPKIGFVTHLDTVDVGLSPDVHPQKIHYSGQDILLNAKENIFFDKAAHAEIEQYLNEDIFFSDGTSVLGADNKAAVTVVMTMAETVMAGDDNHGDLYLAFVPDEEIGLKGSKKLDLKRFCPDYAYTIDCCEKGEVVFETFNAGTAFINIAGVTAHPMSAKGVLVNPILVASDLMNLFDRTLTPECTAGKEGYIWFNHIVGNQSVVTLQASIRDHDLNSYEQKKALLKEKVADLAKQYPTAALSIEIEDVYANIGNNADRHHKAVADIYAAMAALHIEPKTIAMRGGTDGSVLSAKGLITPNYFTGAHNFHSKFEFLPVKSLLASYQLTMELIHRA